MPCYHSNSFNDVIDSNSVHEVREAQSGHTGPVTGRGTMHVVTYVTCGLEVATYKIYSFSSNSLSELLLAGSECL